MKNIDLWQGHNVYKGRAVQQKKTVYTYFVHLLEQVKPTRIVEIGSGHGGLTLFLRNITFPEVEFFSFETHDFEWNRELKDKGVIFSNENIFENNNSIFTLKDEFKHLFERNNTLILCDGGYKIGEFNCLADYTKPGDLILANDYCTDRAKFEELLVWNWLEIEYSNIKDACERNNLKPYMEEDSLANAWGCFKRES